MIARLLKIHFLLVLLITAATIVHAQSVDTSLSNAKQSENNLINQFEWVDSQRNGIHEINFIAGYSFYSTRGFWGKIPGADLAIYTLRYNRKLLIFQDRHLIEYTTEATLAANYTIQATMRYKAGSYTGFGFTPVGFQFNWDQENLVQPFFKSSAGFMYFSEPFPDQRGVRFNFTLELGLGLEFVVAENFSLTTGYKYHHMSNGQFGDINPGIDSNVFYTGFTIF